MSDMEPTAQDDEVDAALADLALLAVARLRTEMSAAKNSKDRIAAANSILDRVGYSRTGRAQAEVADNEIRRALRQALHHGVSDSVARGLEQMAEEEREAWLKDRARAEKADKIHRAAQAAADEERYEAEKRAAQERHDREWAEAAPRRDDRRPDAALDLTQDRAEQGDDGEERDAWLDA